LISVNCAGDLWSDVEAMKISISRVMLFVTLVAMVGVWIAVPTSARAHPNVVAVTLHADHIAEAVSAADAMDCGLDSAEHSACCAASSFGCCAPCVLLAPEPAATTRGEAAIFTAARAKTAAGLLGERFKRPPRFAE
jgi:hypothetical protein